MPKLKTLKDISVKNKRVLMRVDFNVPLEGREKLSKIKATIPTLRYLIKQKAKIILMSHLGRPGGKVVEELRLGWVVKELEKLLRKKLQKLDSAIGKEVEEAIGKMKPGDVTMLENVRFNPGEEKNDPKFAKKLAKLGDIYINEAFASSHRNHASIVGIPKYLFTTHRTCSGAGPSVIGFLFEKEAKELNRIFKNPKRPLVVIIGGAKVAIKIKVIERFLKKADKLLVGGALPNTIFAAKGIDMGKSLVEKDMFKAVEGLDLENPKFQFPVDFVCQNFEISLRSINAVKENESAFDLGPRTVELFCQLIRDAKMVIWNGPLGLVEREPFDKASEAVAKAIVQSKAYSIVGGGDTIAFIKRLGLEKKFNYISTGGGAMLEYLANETLPGIEALKKCKNSGE